MCVMPLRPVHCKSHWKMWKSDIMLIQCNLGNNSSESIIKHWHYTVLKIIFPIIDMLKDRVGSTNYRLDRQTDR